MYIPDGKVSRKEIADYFGVDNRQVIRWEEYDLIPKGEQIKGAGVDRWYDIKDFVKLKRKIKKKNEN
jgi:DNA-binding transcriptional MerR regulator